MTHSTAKVLVVVETNRYEMPMLPGETEKQALTRYLDTGPDLFYQATEERDVSVEEREKE